MSDLNLCEILKGHEGETFYSPIFGNLTLFAINFQILEFTSIHNDTVAIENNGKFYEDADEIAVFPSIDQRDWNKWIEEQEPKVPKFRIGQFVRSKISRSIYKVIDNSDTDNYRFEGTLCPLSEYELEDATPRTWSELLKSSNYEVVGTVSLDINGEDYLQNDSPIEKSALALLKIHQLIEVGYGGNISRDEWDNSEWKYIIVCDPGFHITSTYSSIHTIAFHTREQAEEFLSYPENVQLLRDHFMINK